MSRRRVAITGLGAVTPLGIGARTLYEGWRDGRSGIEGGEAEAREFDPAEYLSRKEARRTDRFSQLAIASCIEALGEAGWSEELPYPPDRIGCVIGTGIGGLATLETQHDVLNERGERAVSPIAIPMLMANAASGMIGIRFGFRGPNYSVVSACAAGAHALGTAMRMVQHGEADAVVAGGSECAMTRLARAGFGRMDAISNSGISRPFDARRDGFVLGEGAGVMVLEDAELAEERGAAILGELTGYGATADAFHLTAPESDGGGAARAMRTALDDAGLRPEDVSWINAHGTSTPLNDRSETAAIKAVFGEHAYRIPVSAPKSTTGHMLGASGAVEAVASVLALRDRTAPPTLNYEEPEEGLDLDYVPNEARPMPNGSERTAAISNSFGFGGHNAVLCLAA